MSIDQPLDQLPDGVSLNTINNQNVTIDFKEQVTNSTTCNKCSIAFESVLLQYDSGKNEGIIRVIGNPSPAWKSSMPKDIVRSIKLLNEALVKKIDTHGKMMHND
jgi:hypothetical protein